MARQRLDFDRWDYLGAKVVLVLMLITVPVGALLPGVLTWIGDGELLGDVGTDLGQASGPEPLAGAELTWHAEATASLADPAWYVWVAALAPGMVVSVATAAVAQAAVTDAAFGDGWSVWVPIDDAAFFLSCLGVVFALLGEAFRQGQQLKAETEGLV